MNSPAENIKQQALEMGADAVGIAAVSEFHRHAPEGHRPDDILKGAKSVIAIGKRRYTTGQWLSSNIDTVHRARSGQGGRDAVGMAIASKWMAEHFNRPDFEMFGYNVYSICGDGCMMEGVTREAASLAGHLRLDNLCPAHLSALTGNKRVERHVLGLERSDLFSSPREMPTERSGDNTLAGIRHRSNDHQGGAGIFMFIDH